MAYAETKETKLGKTNKTDLKPEDTEGETQEAETGRKRGETTETDQQQAGENIGFIYSQGQSMGYRRARQLGEIRADETSGSTTKT